MDEVIATSLGSCRSCSSWTICTSRRGTKEVIDYFSIRVTFFFCFIQDFLHFFRFIMGKHFFSIFSIIWSMSSCLKMGLNESKTTERRWGQKKFHPKKLFFPREMIFLLNFLYFLSSSRKMVQRKNLAIFGTAVSGVLGSIPAWSFMIKSWCNLEM